MTIEFLFLTASKNKYRFESPVGMLMSEDLWGLPLTSKTKANLEDIAIFYHNLIEARGVSFVNSKTTKDPSLSNKLEIVKHVIACREADVADRKSAAERYALLAAIDDAIEGKKQDSIRNMTLEELEEMRKKV